MVRWDHHHTAHGMCYAASISVTVLQHYRPWRRYALCWVPFWFL